MSVTTRYHGREDEGVFGKVFASLWQGSLRGSGVTWAVFVYLLANADREGVVEVVPERIADDTGFGLDKVLESLHELKSPDERSRTPDRDGRRIEPIDEHRDWGWIIVNYEKYRKLKDAETVREQTRTRVTKYRDRVRGGAGAPLRTSPDQQALPEEFVPLEGPVGPTREPRHRGPNGTAMGRKRAKFDAETPEFEKVWAAYHPARRISRRTASRAFVAALGRHKDVTPEDLLAATQAFAKRLEVERRDVQFIPHLTTWLNQDRFMEEFEDEQTTQG